MEVNTSIRSKTTVNPKLDEGLPVWRPKSAAQKQKGNFTVFSRMSKEALQAISETRNELKKITKTTATCIIQPSIPKISSPSSVQQKKPDSHEEDRDSAIGTASQVSQASENQQIESTVKHEKTARSPERMDTVIEVSKSPAIPVREKLDLPMITSPQPRQGETTDYKQIGLGVTASSTPSLAVPEYKNVFERLSSNYKPVQKITARQRSKARLTLRLMKNGPLSSLPSQNNYKTITTRKELPGLTRSQTPSNSIKHTRQSMLQQSTIQEEAQTSHHEPQTIDECISKNTEEPTDTLHKTVEQRIATVTPKPSSSKRPVSHISNREHKEYNHYQPLEREEAYIPPLVVPDLKPEAFEITPIGYDSRYSALQYNDTIHGYADDEEAQEIIKQAKIKCRQWLMKQLELLGSS